MYRSDFACKSNFDIFGMQGQLRPAAKFVEEQAEPAAKKVTEGALKPAADKISAQAVPTAKKVGFVTNALPFLGKLCLLFVVEVLHFTAGEISDQFVFAPSVTVLGWIDFIAAPAHLTICDCLRIFPGLVCISIRD